MICQSDASRLTKIRYPLLHKISMHISTIKDLCLHAVLRMQDLRLSGSAVITDEKTLQVGDWWFVCSPC